MKQEIKSELTRQLIIDKAFVLFYKNGFHPTSVDKVMIETKLTKGAFYHHFKNKKELGVAVISDRIQKRVFESMIIPLSEEKDPILILKEVFSTRIQSFTTAEKQSGCPVNNLINEISEREIAYQLALRKIIDDWKKALIDLLERGKKMDCIHKEVHSPSVAIFLISAFEGVRGIRKLYTDDSILDNYLISLENYINQLR
ncbi:TetR/AcrR family transcriptional regulator [Flavobacterium sp. LB1P62]|uniref:TetR/AcrR family transcriptional regulator n=1 Tax=unclassified Flavobacterium TaxID=196869 RepID=UPI003AB0757B